MPNFSANETRFTLRPTIRVPFAATAPIVASCNSMLNRIFNGDFHQAFFDTWLGATTNLVESATGGSNTAYRFENEPAGEGGELYPKTNMGNYDGLVVSGDDKPALTISEFDYSKQFAHFAWENGAGGDGIETLFQCSWSNPTAPESSGDIGADFISKIASYEELHDELIIETPLGQKPPRIIPTAHVLQRIYNHQLAGTGPTADCFNQLFIHPVFNPGGDVGVDVHLGDKGEWLNAVITGTSLWGANPFEAPDALGTRLQPTLAERTFYRNQIKAVHDADAGRRFGVDSSSWI